MAQQYDPTTIVGLPTMIARFDGPREARPILDALQRAGHPADDVAVLLRPAGTDAVVDLVTGDRAAGQSGDARLLPDQGSTTVVILHPAADRLDAVRAALNALGATQVDYSPETIYTGTQSQEEVEKDIAAAAEEIAHDEPAGSADTATIQ